MRIFFTILFATLFLSACGAPEPGGKAVTLTEEDKSSVKWAVDAKEPWAAWHTKGNRLRMEGKYEEALYCYNEAMKAWPKEFEDKTGKAHQAEPADTILQKGYIYLALKEPELAIKYFEKFSSYRPGTKVSQDGIEKARSLMKK